MTKSTLFLLIVVAGSVVFILGYATRGSIDIKPPSDHQLAELPESQRPDSAPTQSPSDESDGKLDDDQPLANQKEGERFFTSSRTTPRTAYETSKRQRLDDFFTLNGIGSDRADQIIRDLVDADHVIRQMQNDMVDQLAVENAIAAENGEDTSTTTITDEQKSALSTSHKNLYMQALGEYYEAYEEYRRSFAQRRNVRTFESSLPEALEYAARESVVQIMYQEHLKMQSMLGPNPDELGPQDWESERESYYQRVPAMRSYNKSVLERARGYLSVEQYEQFEGFLENDVRRFELMIEMADLEESR